MPHLTLSKRIARYLSAQGYAPVASAARKTRKYIPYRDPHDATRPTYFLGPCGALLVSKSGTLGDSISLTWQIKKQLDTFERQHGLSPSR